MGRNGGTAVQRTQGNSRRDRSTLRLEERERDGCDHFVGNGMGNLGIPKPDGYTSLRGLKS